MLVDPWATLVPTLFVCCAVLSWWFNDPKTLHLNLIVGLGCLVLAWTISPELTRDFAASVSASFMTTVTTLQLDHLVLNNASMLVTGAALVWLLRRGVQTLWKPVPELIGILGVEVPAAPDVSLTAIGVDKATVTWTRPPANRPVHKFVIQVNGVNVGESATNQDTFITVSGLKPNHYYNVRIIAVASNNFQAGSRVLRLRTFGDDGRPRLGASRLPPGFSQDDVVQKKAETSDDTGAPRHVVATFASAPSTDNLPSPGREASSSISSGPLARRNTGGRRHSPSTTSLDQQLNKKEGNGPTEAEMAELNQRYLGLRKDTEETAALIAKEEEDLKRLLEELEAEKLEKRKEQKKKEEQTEKLRREQGTTDRSMRNVQQRKSQKEKQLKEKKDDLKRLHDNMARWCKGIEDMKKEQANYVKQRGELEHERDAKSNDFRSAIADLQQECSHLETELKEKRQQVKDLEEAREDLPGDGSEDAEWPREKIEFKRDWQRKELGYRHQLIEENRKSANLDNHIHTLTAQIQQIPPQSYGHFNQANATGFDIDSNQNLVKQRGRTNTGFSNPSGPSPSQVYAMTEQPPASAGFGAIRGIMPPSFAPGPYMGLSADQPENDEAALRALTAGAPLSPSATSLLPSNIFADDDPPSPSSNPLQIDGHGLPNDSPDDGPQSPGSSVRSPSILSSPRDSSQHLPYSHLNADNSDSHSLQGVLSSPLAPSGQIAPMNRLSGFFSFQRSRAAKALDEPGPALGSLKAGQSQSFPRQTDDDLGGKNRRISLSGGWGSMFNRGSVGPDSLEGGTPPLKLGFSARSLLPFGSRGPSILSERDPSSPRPASIASSDMPRPSTDSNSIWGPPGDHLGKPTRLWSAETPWSRAPSRRPSIHGSPSLLKTNLASAEDEILDEEAIRASPSQVGVIGSRPAAKLSLPKTLNPAAPTFMTNLFRSKGDKDGDGKDGQKSKGKDKARDKGKDKGRGSTNDSPETPLGPSLMPEESPSNSRKSRDGYSVHTQTTVSVSESRESLSLDQPFSNTPSEPSTSAAGAKDTENAFRKLFRKDSTSKLSLTQRIRSRGSKGTSSVTNSERNMGLEHSSSLGDFEDIGDESSLGRSLDSVTSSPSLGPAKSKERTESKLKPSTAWLAFKKKASKEKDSLDLERASEAETTEDERKT